jgi:hypothetical protein
VIHKSTYAGGKTADEEDHVLAHQPVSLDLGQASAEI